MNDIAQTGLKEPEQTDWDNYGKTWAPPPVPVNPDGSNRIFLGVAEVKETDPDDGYLNYLLDPIKLVKSGTADGYIIRFTRASLRKFNESAKTTKLGNFLKACGMSAKPQTNDEYRAAARQVSGRTFPFVGDWEGYSKETGESIKGYDCFPDDPERPGQKKAILKAGDTYTVRDKKGNVLETKTVQANVIFANLKVKYFQDPSRSGAK